MYYILKKYIIRLCNCNQFENMRKWYWHKKNRDKEIGIEVLSILNKYLHHHMLSIF